MLGIWLHNLCTTQSPNVHRLYTACERWVLRGAFFGKGQVKVG